MSVTAPTCHAERLPLKAAAPENTAPHSNKEKSKDKNGLVEKKKKRREHCSKIYQCDKEEGKNNQPKQRPDLGTGGGRVHVLEFMYVTFPTCHAERLPLKAPAL